MAIEMSAAGWLNMAITVFRDIYLARWFIYETFYTKMFMNFWMDLFIRAGGMSSPHIGGANAIVIIFREI